MVSLERVLDFPHLPFIRRDPLLKQALQSSVLDMSRALVLVGLLAAFPVVFSGIHVCVCCRLKCIQRLWHALCLLLYLSQRLSFLKHVIYKLLDRHSIRIRFFLWLRLSKVRLSGAA